MAVAIEHSGSNIDFDIGEIMGINEARISGNIPSEDVEALGILAWNKVNKCIHLDLQQFCSGWVFGYHAVIAGIA